MAFENVLFSHNEDHERARKAAEPDFFVDLNLDQLVASVVAGRECIVGAPSLIPKRPGERTKNRPP